MINLEKSQQLSIDLKHLTCLKNLDAAKSQLKIHNLKFSNQAKKTGLDSRENIDSFNKLILTHCEILTLIGLDCRGPQAYKSDK